MVESGRVRVGVSVTHHGNSVYFRIFVYDTGGHPLPFVVSVAPASSATSFAGVVQTTTGPWFGRNSFDPNQVERTTVGTASLAIGDANNGMPSYAVNGAAIMKSITRMYSEFAPHIWRTARFGAYRIGAERRGVSQQKGGHSGATFDDDDGPCSNRTGLPISPIAVIEFERTPERACDDEDLPLQTLSALS